MEPEKEQWISDVMGSLDELNRVEPGPFLFAKIRHKLAGPSASNVVSGRLVWLMAASFAVLALLNWQILAGTSVQNSQPNGELSTVITDMHLMPSNNQLYE